MPKKKRQDKKRDYEVGYGRPPKHSQFKKGQSGNPSGRPKEPTTFLASFNKQLSKDVKVIKDGKEYHITGLSAVSQKFLNSILSGDYKFMKLFLDKTAKDIDIESYLYPEPEIAQEGDLVPENPTPAVREFIAEVRSIICQAMQEKIDNGEHLQNNAEE